MVTIERLRKAHYIAAKLVEKLGPEYLVFFDRVHKELGEAQKKQELITIALALAKDDKSN